MNKRAIAIGIAIWIIPVLIMLQILTWIGLDRVTKKSNTEKVLTVDFKVEEAPKITDDFEKEITAKKAQENDSIWIIQLGAFSEERYAKALEKKLKNANFPIYRIKKEQEGKSLYLLRMGPFVKRPEAEKYRDELNRQLKIKSFIFKVNS